jgi:hypothetical protein
MVDTSALNRECETIHETKQQCRLVAAMSGDKFVLSVHQQRIGEDLRSRRIFECAINASLTCDVLTIIKGDFNCRQSRVPVSEFIDELLDGGAQAQAIGREHSMLRSKGLVLWLQDARRQFDETSCDA